MDRILLDSTVLAWVRYLPETRLLQLGMRSGEDYQYFDVPAALYSQLLSAKSKGRYYNLQIRNEFRFKRINKCAAR